ncbi:MAG: hypothetical protein KatS3mg001_239 [Candidatus Pacearchaeota archaeon]|nr:MAG: hypothetical protein KatS3mg001_239 [Candidatus Pacearchaeota archaeon]
MVLDSYTTSIIINLFSLFFCLVAIFLLFEIKKRVVGDFARGFTFLIFSIIIVFIFILFSLINKTKQTELNLLNDFLFFIFTFFVSMFTISMYNVLGRIIKERKKIREFDKKEKVSKKKNKLVESRKPKISLIGGEEYIDLTNIKE